MSLYVSLWHPSLQGEVCSSPLKMCQVEEEEEEEDMEFDLFG